LCPCWKKGKKIRKLVFLHAEENRKITFAGFQTLINKLNYGGSKLFLKAIP
jgi:hypothetical protein